jgi:uncharacterized protein YjbJ (UPF0337 family)
MWNKNERKAKIDQVSGKIKLATATLTRNDKLKAEGQLDETVGKVGAADGRTGRKTGKAVVRAGHALKRLRPSAAPTPRQP